MGFLKRYAGWLTFTMAVVDCLCILLAGWVAAIAITPLDAARTVQETFYDHRFYVGVFTVVWFLAASEQRLFASRRGDSLLTQLFALAKAMAFALGVTAIATIFISRQGMDKDFFIALGLSATLFIFLFRSTLRLGLWAIRRRGYNFRQILIVGGNARARHLVEVMMRHGEYGYHLIGLLDDDTERIRFLADYSVPYLGPVHELERILTNQVVDEVYICLPVRRYYTDINQVAHLCEGCGIPVRLIADLFPLRVAISRVHQIEDIPLLSLSAIPEAFAQLIVKRGIDMIVSFLFLLLIGSWLFPLVALLIKLESKGPVFFLQERVGLNQRRFNCIKFRSMVVNAEDLKPALMKLNEADGPVFKMRRDPRMTHVGRWLRKFSIDELPQFINVFLGDMSLVGPRPPVPNEVAKYTWDQRRRLSVRPGITGLQQVSGRSDVPFDEWVEMDLAYIDNWSLMEDIRILFRTVQVVVSAKGAA